MSIRELVESDLAVTVEGEDDFGWPVTVTDPDGNSISLFGSSDDIAQVIDPDTGQAVSGRLASVVFRNKRFYDAGMGLPVGVADASSKPWVVEFDDINGLPYKFKVQKSNPDRAVGVVSCLLELYE